MRERPSTICVSLKTSKLFIHKFLRHARYIISLLTSIVFLLPSVLISWKIIFQQNGNSTDSFACIKNSTISKYEFNTAFLFPRVDSSCWNYRNNVWNRQSKKGLMNAVSTTKFGPRINLANLFFVKEKIIMTIGAGVSPEFFTFDWNLSSSSLAISITNNANGKSKGGWFVDGRAENSSRDNLWKAKQNYLRCVVFF